ncbi:GGDEF domain-containing protein [Acinetobacter sp. ASP199]|uniref:GGDEF domain-containing protein n=1 Tax=unclassified Acinetobacter TaxID=196816 RepID=UPI001F61E2BC|nr:GGDEF domain-containing protein [Acinetobacter sp. ASP199]UNT59165.1 GGDEF domain-containing protein [Acinetobacter sp. ASP199]
MPQEYHKESRLLIQQALKDPLVRIPQPLKSAYYSHQKKLHLRYLLQVNLFAQFAYASYTFADIYVLRDIHTLLLVTKLGFTSVMTLITVWMYQYSRNLALFDLLLPTSIIGASAVWFFNLNQSESPYNLIYQYSSLIFIVLANLSVHIRFKPSLIISALITLMIYIGVYFNVKGDLQQLVLFSLIYLPVLSFSIYISWNSTLKSRLVFLQHTLNEYNRQAFEHMAHTDSLTGLNNRRFFEYLAQQHIAHTLEQETPNPSSLIVFDVDHFKKINDNYGHDIGDRVLQIIAETAQSEMRDTDILARYGGEEFIALLPDTHLDDALKIADCLRQRIEQAEVFLDQGQSLKFTISVGAAILKTCETDLYTVIKQADIALYQAKANGRNRVEQYDPLINPNVVLQPQGSWNKDRNMKLAQE